MASLHWMNQNSDGSSYSYAGKEIPELDLTLKLGSTEKSLRNTNANVLNPNPNFSNINFNSTPHQEARPVGGHGSREYQYRMAELPMNPGFGNNFPVNNEGRIDYGLNKLYDSGNHQYSQNMIDPLSSRVENNFNMMNNEPGSSMMKANLNPTGLNTATFAFPPPPITNEYTLIDTPARRNRKIENHHPYLNSSSAATVGERGVRWQHVAHDDPKRSTNFNSSTVIVNQRGARRQRTRTYHVPKRCTNFNCGTTETPMWCCGPLGPKTLCNACGIKYRKEEEKRKAKEASKSSG